MINVINRGVKNGYGDFSVKNRKTYTSRFFFHDWIFFPDWKEKTISKVLYIFPGEKNVRAFIGF